MKLKSSTFNLNDSIPKHYTGEGSDSSPPLEWENLPQGTKELAIICDDPDAPTPEPWVHWIIYNIPGTVSKLPEGIPTKENISLPPGALQGKNSWGRTGYGGPMPPPGHGWHRYFFRLYAIDKNLSLGSNLSKRELLEAMKGHILAQTELVGRYKR